jgi:ABC-type transport system substrate-binding protein
MRLRSRLSITFTILMIASLLLASCGSPAAPTQEGAASDGPAATAPATETNTDSNNSITIVIAEDPPSCNPIVADTGYDGLVMELVMLGLADVDPDGNVFPELAAALRS